MPHVVGANTASTYSSLTEGRTFGLGDTTIDHAGTEWVFVKAASAIDQYDMVNIDNDFNAASASLSGTALGQRLGVAQVAFATSDYGWVAVRGHNVSVNVSGTATASTQLYIATGTGALSTTASSGTLEGVVLLTGSSATAVQAALPVLLTWPHFKSL
jgi:hypothetical protein